MRHKVFISYHHANDQEYKNKLIQDFSDDFDGMVNKSVGDGDINPWLKTDTIRAKIRDEFLRDSTVTIVLIGSETWKRKHVDWEISGSIRDTMYNPRSGLVGLILPSHPAYNSLRAIENYKNTIPPRLYDNYKKGYAKIYNWTDYHFQLQEYIHEAFLNRNKIIPDNSFPSFVNNRSGFGWQR